MPCIFSLGGIRFIIYLNDHGPPHVHAVGPGWNMKVLLGRPPGLLPRIGAIRGRLGPAMQRRILEIVHEHSAHLLTRWKEIHG